MLISVLKLFKEIKQYSSVLQTFFYWGFQDNFSYHLILVRTSVPSVLSEISLDDLSHDFVIILVEGMYFCNEIQYMN